MLKHTDTYAALATPAQLNMTATVNLVFSIDAAVVAPRPSTRLATPRYDD